MDMISISSYHLRQKILIQLSHTPKYSTINNLDPGHQQKITKQTLRFV